MAKLPWGFKVIQDRKSLTIGLQTISEDPVRHGRWSQPLDGWMWRCSDCGNESEHYSNYCPHCGAKMTMKKDEGEVE